jgi:hypothetical protein
MKKKFLYSILFLFLILVIYSFIQDYKLRNEKFENSIVYIGQKEIQVNFVPKNSIYPAFGLAFSNEVRIREDLSPRVKRFVLAHELYHTGDNAKWGGWVGREVRANLVPAISDPAGFTATVFASLTPSRLLFYLDRFKRGN